MDYKTAFKCALAIQVLAIALGLIIWAVVDVPVVGMIGTIVLLALVLLLPSLIVPRMSQYDIRGISSVLAMLIAGIIGIFGSLLDSLSQIGLAIDEGENAIHTGPFQFVFTFLVLALLIQLLSRRKKHKPTKEDSNEV